jgi:hypothetical protein
MKGFENDKGFMNKIKESDGEGDLMTSDFNIESSKCIDSWFQSVCSSGKFRKRVRHQ